MKRLLLGIGVLCACGGTQADQSPEPSARAAVKTQSNADAKAGAVPEPSADPSAAAVDEAPTEAVDGPPDAEHWLVWHGQGSQWQTTWFTVAKDGSSVTETAKRKAVVVSDGTELWALRRSDTERKVMSCGCLDAEAGSAMCTKLGSVTALGLQAHPMTGSEPNPLVKPFADDILGEVDELSLRLLGGVGSRVFAAVGESGYFCGAHGSYGSSYPLLDPSAATEPTWPKISLPTAMLKKAANTEEAMLDTYRECEDDATITVESFVDVMSLSNVEMSLAAGEVNLRWTYRADVPYACSADYGVWGSVNSGLLAEAEPLGLPASPSPGLKAALAKVGDAPVIGWSSLELGDESRAKALTWFRKTDDKPWPADTQTQKTARTKAATPSEALARTKLTEGRGLTKAGEYAKAVAALGEGIDADATDGRLWGERCYAHLRAKNHADATKDCEAALTREGSDAFKASVHYNLGLIARAQGNTAKAKQAFETSLELRPNKTVQAALDGL